EPRPHRIARRGHDDRNFCRRTFRRLYGWSLRGNDNINLEINQLCSQREQTIQLPFRRAILDLHILAVDVTEFPKALRKQTRKRFALFDQQYTELRKLWLLRAHTEWPRRRAREYCDDIAPSHAITLSAPFHRAIPSQGFKSERSST